MARHRSHLSMLEKTITSEMKRLKSSSDAAFTSYVRIGRALCEAKEQKLVPHGAFDGWCLAKFGLEKSQRCDLMRLYRHRHEIDEARRKRARAGESLEKISVASSLDLLKSEKLRRNDHRGQTRLGENTASHPKICLSLTESSREIIRNKLLILQRDGYTLNGCFVALDLAREAAERNVSLIELVRACDDKTPVRRNFPSFRLMRVPAKSPYSAGVIFKLKLDWTQEPPNDR